MRHVVLLVLLGVTLSADAAPAPLPRRDRGEKETLDGEWKLVPEKSRGFGGGGPGGQPENLTLTVRGKQMTLHVQEDTMKMEIEAEITLGPGPNPRPIDLRFVRMRMNGQDMPKEQAQETSLGLFRLEGNTLTLGMGPGNNKRPRSLEDKSIEVMVFTRLRR